MCTATDHLRLRASQVFQLVEVFPVFHQDLLALPVELLAGLHLPVHPALHVLLTGPWTLCVGVEYFTIPPTI